MQGYIDVSVARSWLGRWTCDWRSRVQSKPLHCRVRPWTSCSHALSSASEVTTLMALYKLVYTIHYTTGRSGLVLAREVPGSNPRCWQVSVLFSWKSLRYAAFSTGCTLTAVSRTTQLSTLRGTANEYQPSLLSNNTWRQVNVRPLAAYRRTHSFAAWHTSWRPPGADRLSLGGPTVNSHICLRAVHDGAINVVFCTITILLLYYRTLNPTFLWYYRPAALRQKIMIKSP